MDYRDVLTPHSKVDRNVCLFMFLILLQMRLQRLPRLREKTEVEEQDDTTRGKWMIHASGGVVVCMLMRLDGARATDCSANRSVD